MIAWGRLLIRADPQVLSQRSSVVYESRGSWVKASWVKFIWAVALVTALLAGGWAIWALTDGAAIQAVASKPHKPAPSQSVPTAKSDARHYYLAGQFPILTLPDGEREPVRSLLNVDGPLPFGSYVWDEEGVPEGPVWVRVDIALQMISVFRAGHEIGVAVILYGAESKPTPPGVYKVIERARTHRSNLYDAEMPYMLRLTTDGIAIHASHVRPGAATHGCIGVPEPFAALLFEEIRRDDRVVIIDSKRLSVGKMDKN